MSITAALLVQQGGKCKLCDKAIDTTVRGRTSDYVLDHNHETGEIRGVLHRSCNAAEGKITNAAGSWGAKSMKYADIIPFLENLVNYLKKTQGRATGMMYPDHKTPEQKADAQRLKRNKAAAAKRAAATMAKRKAG